jgi:hypothetical protein
MIDLKEIQSSKGEKKVIKKLPVIYLTYKN